MSASTHSLKYFHFNALLQQENWVSPAYVGIDEHGIIQYVSDQKPTEAIAIEYVDGYALPGFQNAHSHAFQYAMAGLAEKHQPGTYDDFWTWREAMYQCALTVDPDQAQAIAAMLYAEMLRHGYTHVAEFHYLHHDKDGKPYNNLAEMGERMVAAANDAGIKITLIPVFYQKGGFDLEPQPRQRRFISKKVDDYFELLDASARVVKDQPHAKLAFSVHSLRAVNPTDIIETFNKGPKDLPFHLHIAEQLKEVDNCVQSLKKRPVEWLLENLPVDQRFHLVHATHLNDHELSGLASSKATVVLCPSTEGNLGDGIFRMREYVQQKGNWCIGTDSHIGLSSLEEFRMIDYRQRLVTHQRNTFEGEGARYMINAEVSNGRVAMGVATENHFAINQPLDAYVINSKSPLLSFTSMPNVLSTIIYSVDASMALGTLVNGKWVVRNQKHNHSISITKAFTQAMREIKSR